MGEYVMSRSPVYSLVLVFLIIGMLDLVVRVPEVKQPSTSMLTEVSTLRQQISPLLTMSTTSSQATLMRLLQCRGTTS